MAVPSVVPLKVAVYVPLPSSCTVLNVPLLVPLFARLSCTTCPAMGLLSASSTVTVTKAPPPCITVLLLILAMDWLKLTAPVVTWMVAGLDTRASPLTVTTRLLKLPAVTPVKLIVYEPSPLSFVLPNVPLLVPVVVSMLAATVCDGSGLPSPSTT